MFYLQSNNQEEILILMIRLHSLGTRITSRSVRRSCTARCEGLALLGAKVLHRSGQGSRPARIRHTRSAEQRPFARACKDLLLERAKTLCSSERDILFRAREPASSERGNGGLRGDEPTITQLRPPKSQKY